jgi:hypothetical protein
MESKGARPPDGVLLARLVTETETHTITRRAVVMMLGTSATTSGQVQHDGRGSVEETTRVVTKTMRHVIPQMTAGPAHCGRRGVQPHADDSAPAESHGVGLDQTAAGEVLSTSSAAGAFTNGGWVGTMAELTQAGRVEDVGCNIATMLLAAAISGARVSLLGPTETTTRMVDGFADTVATGQCFFLQWAIEKIVVSFAAPQWSTVAAAFPGFPAGPITPLRVWDEAASSLIGSHKLMLTDVPLRDHMSGLVAGNAMPPRTAVVVQQSKTQAEPETVLANAATRRAQQKETSEAAAAVTTTRMVDIFADDVATGQCFFLQWATEEIAVSFAAPQWSVFPGFPAGLTPLRVYWEEVASLGSGRKIILTDDDVPLRDHMSRLLVAGNADSATSTGVTTTPPRTTVAVQQSKTKTEAVVAVTTTTSMMDIFSDIVATGQCFFLQWATEEIVVSFVAPQPRSVVAAFPGVPAGTIPRCASGMRLLPSAAAVSSCLPMSLFATTCRT